MNFLGNLGGTEALFANLSAAGAAAAAAAATGSHFADTGGSLNFQDKRNRNPNWTDHEIVRFLEMLQEDETVKDLVANRNKKVFCLIAQRMCAEGAEKTWDQCRIKLKNLKSQYRYVKERIPDIDTLDLEDDNVVRQLISECQGRGISPSSIKHLRFLLRFLNKQREFGKYAESAPSGTAGANARLFAATGDLKGGKYHPESSLFKDSPLAREIFNKSLQTSKEEAAVSPPSSPFPNQIAMGLKLVNENSLKNEDRGVDPLGAPASKPGVGLPTNGLLNSVGGVGMSEQGYKFLEQFNREMLDQFMEHQRRTQASFTRWEQERWRQERESMERWRQEARDHERALFGMFCTAMSKCNAAITAVLKAKNTSASNSAAAAAASKNGQCNPLKRKADQAVDGSPKSAGAAPGAAGDKKSKMGDGESDDIGDGIEEIGEDDEDEDDDETDAERLQNELQNMVQVSMEEEEEEEGEEDALEDALLQDDDSNSKDMPSE